MEKKKHLSAIANDVLRRSSLELNTTVDALVEEFDAGWKPDQGDYSRKLVQLCSLKALSSICCAVKEKFSDGTFSRFTFDMMLAWEMPSPATEASVTENIAKEREDGKMPVDVAKERDEIPLFYSDLMPLLVDNEPYAGEDAFVWLGSILPLVADVTNGRFTFETLTAPTGRHLHFPAYDMFLKEIDRCVEHLQKQETPTGVHLADDEFILHVEGTASTQRVVRHIGGTSWPGRLTVTNYALYFEASGIISYEDALKIDLSEDIDHSAKPSATGPWGAPVYDKAIVYQSSELPEGIVLEFPEMTSSTRRDHWLALVREVILLHRFLSKFKVESTTQAWEMHARTILGIIRLHAAREMLRISPPVPTKLLIFSLMDELPKGDYVLEELADSLKMINCGHPCSASSILRSLNMSLSSASYVTAKEDSEERASGSAPGGEISSLESAVDQALDDAKEVDIAKATVQGLQEEGISDGIYVLLEQLRPLEIALHWFQDVITWRRPTTTLIFYAATLTVTYKEWLGMAGAVFLVWLVAKMLQLRHENKSGKMVVSTASDQTTMESIVWVQHGLRTVQDMVQKANIAVLKIRSIFVSTTTKHANQVMAAMIGLAILLLVVPLKIIIMAITLFYAITSKLGKYMQNGRGGGGFRRLKEWWDSIPVIPVETVDDGPSCPKKFR